MVTLEGGVLTMAEVGRDTLYFSDRPDRIVGRETTQEFVEQWGTGADSFEANPPNAVLSITHGSKLEDIVVVLMNPRLVDADLVYDVEVLDGEERASGVGAFFIDSIGRPLTPVSVAGTTRRVARRTTRRVVRRT